MQGPKERFTTTTAIVAPRPSCSFRAKRSPHQTRAATPYPIAIRYAVRVAIRSRPPASNASDGTRRLQKRPLPCCDPPHAGKRELLAAVDTAPERVGVDVGEPEDDHRHLDDPERAPDLVLSIGGRDERRDENDPVDRSGEIVAAIERPTADVHRPAPYPRAIPATISAVSVGVVPTRMPFASSAAFFASAVPDEPEMIAPAWPIVFPGGAVNPAM